MIKQLHTIEKKKQMNRSFVYIPTEYVTFLTFASVIEKRITVNQRCVGVQNATNYALEPRSTRWSLMNTR